MITLDQYTKTWSADMNPRSLEAGERYRTPSTSWVDGREWSDFRTLMRKSGLIAEHVETSDGWDVNVLIVDPNLEEDDD